MKKRVVFGILFFGMFLFGLGFFVSATVTINSIDFPSQIGSSFNGKAFVNITDSENNQYLLKTKWYKNGELVQQDSYIDGEVLRNTIYNPEDDRPELKVTIFDENYMIWSGSDLSSPGTSQARITTIDGKLIYLLNETNGENCRDSVYYEGLVYLACYDGTNSIFAINTTDYSSNILNSTTTSGALFVAGGHDLEIFEDYLFLGSRNNARLINASNTSQLIESFSTTLMSYGYFDNETRKLYVVDLDTFYEYDLDTDTKTQTVDMASSWGTTEKIIYGFQNDNKLLVLDFTLDKIYTYNKTNLSQQLDNISYSKELLNYQYYRETSDPNMFWSLDPRNDADYGWSIVAIDRDLEQVVFPYLKGTYPPVVVYDNEISTNSFPMQIQRALNYVDSLSYTGTKSFDSGNLSVGDNLTLEISAFSYDGSFVSRQNLTAEVSNYSINLSFPLPKMVIQRNQSGIGKLNIFGNYSGENITSFNMTYLGNSSGVLEIELDGNNQFNETIFLKQGDYIFQFEYGNVTLAEIREFGVGDVLIVHGQSNAVNTNNGGYAVTKSLYGVYKTTDTEANSCSTSDYYSSLMETSNRWAELAHLWSINQSVPVIVHNFAVGGRTIDYITNTCLPLNFVTLNEVTGGDMKVRAHYWYQGEADEDESFSYYYSALENYSQIFFGNVSFPFGENFVVGQVLSTPITPSSGEVMRAIQSAWYTLTGIYRGSVMYDIKTGDDDGVHPSGIGKVIFEKRNNRAMLNFLGSLFASPPILENVYVYNSSRLIMDFSKSDLEVSYWNDTNSTIPQGINISSLGISSENISNVSFNSNYVVLDYNSNALVSGVNLTLCVADLDCYAQPVIRESFYGVPAEKVYNITLQSNSQFNCEYDGRYWYSGSCHATPEEIPSSTTDDTTSSGSGKGTYKPSKSSLENGFSVNVIAGQKVQITYSDGKTKIVEVESVDEEKVVVSVEGIDYEIGSSASVKIDLDDDGFYDVEISNKKVYSNGIANLEFKLINEEVPAGEEKSNIGKVIDGVSEAVKNIEWYVYVIIGVVIVLIVVGIVLKRKK